MRDALDWRRKALPPLMAALLLRLCWGLVIPVVPVSDSVAYDTFALNIARGIGYGWTAGSPTAYWPVGTSAIYGGMYWLFGHHYLPIVVFQIVVGVIVVALTMALAQRWLGSHVAVIAGWIVACWPLLIQYTTILASELYFVVFVLLAAWFAGRDAETWKTWVINAVLTGVALAAASYVRPLALIMAPLFYLPALINGSTRRFALVGCLLALTMMSLCILPWAIRNWQIFERVVPISTNGGANLWMGNNPSGSLEYMALPNIGLSNEADKDKYFADQAKQYIVEHPLAFTVRTIRKIVSLHDRETIGATWNEKGIAQRLTPRGLLLIKAVSTLWWWCLLFLGVFGIVFFAKRGLRQGFLPLCLWAYFTAVHSVSVAGDRYHVPSIPFIAMLSALALSSLAVRKSRQAASG